jgi:hypothetical protein
LTGQCVEQVIHVAAPQNPFVKLMAIKDWCGVERFAAVHYIQLNNSFFNLSGASP